MKRVPVNHELLGRGEIGPESLDTYTAGVAAGEQALSFTLWALTNVAVVVLVHLYISIGDVVGVGPT